MKKSIRLFNVPLSVLALVAASLAAGPSAVADLREIHSDSGIFGPPYDHIEADLDSLQSRHPELAHHVFYGITAKGNKLGLLRIAKQGVVSKTGFLISGAIHGNEYLNIEDRAAPWILDEASKPGAVSDFLNAGGVFYVIPIMNPDGYIARERENSHGQDLNRDFTIAWQNYPGFKELETRQLDEYLERDTKENGIQLRVTLDYHCCAGALLYPWSFDAPPIEAKDLLAHRKVGEIMQAALGHDYEYGTTPVVLGYPALGTSKDHYYEKYHSLSFTFEGQRVVEKKNLAAHERFWAGILAALSSGEI